MKRIITILLIVLFYCQTSSAQNLSNRGKEFWLGYGLNAFFFPAAGSSFNSQELALYISTIQPATVTVSINSTGWTQTLNIPANTVNATILIPKSGVNDARIMSDGLSTKGIHIVSDEPVAVFAHTYALFFSAATMLMPVESWGYKYYSVNYYQTMGLSPLPITVSNSRNFENEYCWFFVVAKDDNTRVEITPSDTTNNGWLPGQTYTINLNKGETYSVFGKAFFIPGNSSTSINNSSKDMTGSKILSVAGGDGKCHPVALFSGSGGTRICNQDGGESMLQQIFPAQAWGTKYLTHHTLNNTSTNINASFRNYYRICVQDPTTVVLRNGVPMTGLINNFFYECMDSTGGDYITADKPILVSQYTPNINQCWNDVGPFAYGDPEMIYLSPIEQGQKNVLFYTSSKFGIDYDYCNITLPTTGVASLRVDGVPIAASRIKVHPNKPDYSVAFANLTNVDMQHTITSDSTFTAIVYGIGYWESYGYSVGTNINNLNAFGEIRNTQSTVGGVDSFTCRNTPFRLFAKLAYPATNINWRLSQVPGLFPNTDSIIANPVPVATSSINGRTYYTYSLQQDFTLNNVPGNYYLPVAYTHPDIDLCDNTDTLRIELIVKQGPVADFSTSAATCLKDTINFTGTSTTTGFNIVNYLWNFDDATTQSTVNASKLFATAGPQNVRYRIYADNGCIGDTTKLLIISPSPFSIMGVTPTTCAGDSVLISDTSTIASGTITNWRYDFGDGNTLVRSTNTNFYHTYSLPGTYTISLVTVSNNGCFSDTAFKTVNVFAKPVSLFGAAGSICARDSVLITDTSSISIGSINSWRYDFGDGNTLVRTTNTAFYHPYTTAGTYVISLVTISDMGCKSDTFRRTVTVNDKPRSDFSVSALNCLKDTVYFTHITPPPGAYNITGYLWNFDDATTQSTIDAKKKFVTSGVQNIRYRIFTAEGCTGDTTKQITLFDSPIARLGVTAAICADSVLVTDTSSIAVGSITSWEYDFGDGNTLIRSTNTPFYHRYINPGTYSISLVTTSNQGCKSDTSWQTVNVTSKPLTDFSNTLINCLRDTVTFTHVNPPGSFNITGYLWNFDDGSSQTTIDAKKKFTTAGIQNIRYRIFTAEGCIGDTIKQIDISPDPLANFGANSPVCLSDSVFITDTSAISSGTISNWRYNFGDGNSLVRNNNSSFYNSYLTAGTYSISLVTVSALGCISDTARRTVVIAPKPTASLSYLGSLCTGTPITFTSSYLPAPGSTWYWDFGDGNTTNTMTGNTATHTYATAQTNISVRHMVTNGSGCKSDTGITVIPAINLLPVAAFSIAKDTACETMPILFSSSATGITAWDWNFGNGTGTSTPPFTRIYNTAGSYPVSLIVTGNGGCKSAPVNDILIVNPTPVVNAGPDKNIIGGNSVTLNASVNPPGTYNYLWTPSTGLNDATILQPLARPLTNTTYVLKAENVNTHCSSTDDVLVKIIPDLHIPNSFTPNGDTKNDKWIIPAMVAHPNALVTILNRYGEMIYVVKNYASRPWDGSYKGVQQPNGAYVYVIQLNDTRNQVFQGTVMIIR
ncbi:MAG: PKD domain-containing protein [Ferruginibacter sp.]